MVGRRQLFIVIVVMLGICFSAVSMTSAQGDAATCSAVVSEALTALGTNCANLARGTTCLGSEPITNAAFSEGVATDFYTQAGDRAELAVTDAIQTGPLNLETGTWGLNVMNVGANVPDSLSKGVIYVQFGGVEVENGVEAGEDLSPMQSFYFRTGIGGTPCAQAPSLLFVQGPENAPADLVVFGQPVRLHSTMVLRSVTPGDELGSELQLIVLSGLVILYPDSDSPIIVPPGFVVTIQLGSEIVSLGTEGDADEKGVIGRWSDPRPLTAVELAEMGVLELLPGNIINYPVDVPGIIIASGLGGVFPILDFPPNSPALAAAALACEFGQLPEDICQFLGLAT